MSVRRLDSTGEPVFGRKTSILRAGSEEVLTRINMALKLAKEEWFLDENAGVAWFEDSSKAPRIFGGHADEQLLASEIKRVILSVNGVSTLLSFTLTLDHDTRRASVDCTYSDVYGEALSLSLVLP